MTYNEKKSLYESIMKVAAKIVKKQINEADTLSLEPIKKESEVFGQHIKAFNNNVVKASDSPAMAAPILTILDLLGNMIASEQEDMVKNIARILQLWKSGNITEPQLTKFLLDHAFKSK
jgi:hypothetical protein